MDKRYLVGWCPECGHVTVVREDDDATCGCGHELLSLTTCNDADDVAHAIPLIESIMGAALKSYDFRGEPKVSLKDEASEEEDRDARRAREQAERLLFSILRDHGVEPDERDGRQDHLFIIAPTPFPVWVPGASAEEALAELHDSFDECAIAGFVAALDRDDLGYTIVPVDGDHCFAYAPNYPFD